MNGCAPHLLLSWDAERMPGKTRIKICLKAIKNALKMPKKPEKSPEKFFKKCLHFMSTCSIIHFVAAMHGSLAQLVEHLTLNQGV